MCVNTSNVPEHVTLFEYLFINKQKVYIFSVDGYNLLQFSYFVLQLRHLGPHQLEMKRVALLLLFTTLIRAQNDEDFYDYNESAAFVAPVPGYSSNGDYYYEYNDIASPGPGYNGYPPDTDLSTRVPVDECRVVVYDNETMFFGLSGCANGGMGKGAGAWVGYNVTHAYPYCCQWDYCVPDTSMNTLGGICYDPYRTMACCLKQPAANIQQGIPKFRCHQKTSSCEGTDFETCCDNDSCVVSSGIVCQNDKFTTPSCCSLYDI